YQLSSARLTYYAGFISNPRLTDKDYPTFEEGLQDAYYTINSQLHPWEGGGLTHRRGKEFDTARQKYIDAFGVDPADPKFKEWEAERIKEMLADNGPPSLSPEQELAERFAKKRK